MLHTRLMELDREHRSTTATAAQPAYLVNSERLDTSLYLRPHVDLNGTPRQPPTLPPPAQRTLPPFAPARVLCNCTARCGTFSCSGWVQQATRSLWSHGRW